jgi:hypothetical protein
MPCSCTIKCSFFILVICCLFISLFYFYYSSTFIQRYLISRIPIINDTAHLEYNNSSYFTNESSPVTNNTEYKNEMSIEKLKNYFSNVKSTERFAVMEDTGAGYANRAYALITCFLVCIVKNASLVIKWNTIDSYMEMPLPNVHFNPSKKWEHALLNKPKYSVYKVVTSSTPNAFQLRKNFSTFLTSLPDARNAYTLNLLNPLFFELAANPAHFGLLLDLGLVSAQVIKKARLKYERYNSTRNITNNELVETIHHVGYSLAYNTLNKVFVPNSNMKKLIEDYVDANFTGNYVIGFQIRTEFLDPKDHVHFLRCILDYENRVLNETSRPVKWFVSTDSSELLDLLRKNHPTRVISSTGVIAHISSNSNAYRRVVLDNELLSKCDELFVTGGSTFGALAAMRAGVMPLFFNGMRNNTQCSRMNFTNLPSRVVTKDFLAANLKK